MLMTIMANIGANFILKWRRMHLWELRETPAKKKEEMRWHHEGVKLG